MKAKGLMRSGKEQKVLQGGFVKTKFVKPKEFVRSWYIADVKDVVLGRAASKIAMVLMGKHKPTYTPTCDTGDMVVAINSDKMVLTGKKLDQKIDFKNTGYPEGSKYTPYRIMMQKKSDEVLKLAVKGMLPKSTLGRYMLKKLKVFMPPI